MFTLRASRRGHWRQGCFVIWLLGGTRREPKRSQQGPKRSPEGAQRKPTGSQKRVKIGLGTLLGLPWAPKGGRRMPQGLSDNILEAFWAPFGASLEAGGVKRKSFWRENGAHATFFVCFFLEMFQLAFWIDFGGRPTLTIVWFL